jgi:peptidoglycan hydrolase-like protein with peptidoglycan-binding domain
MRHTVLIIVLTGFLSACGTLPRERGLSGAGIGAVAGAVIGALTGLSLVEGAALGATGGALVGIVTDREDIDLGEPVWTGTRGEQDGEYSHTTIETIQENLAQIGYDPGPSDGVMGSKTKEAIMKYQQDHNLLVDGRASTELMTHLQTLYMETGLVIE